LSCRSLHTHCMYLLTNDLIPRYQSAYRTKHSTETALLRVWSDMLNDAAWPPGPLRGVRLRRSRSSTAAVGARLPSGRLMLCCGGSIHSCLIVHIKLPTEASCVQLDRCCSAFHKAPFWGHCCTFCTLPNWNMWSYSMACVYTGMLMTANFTFTWQSATLWWRCGVSLHVSATSVTGCGPAGWDSIQPRVTEVMWLGSYQQLKHVDVDDISILSTQVKVTESDCNLGVVLDSQLSLSSHVAAL